MLIPAMYIESIKSKKTLKYPTEKNVTVALVEFFSFRGF